MINMINISPVSSIFSQKCMQHKGKKHISRKMPTIGVSVTFMIKAEKSPKKPATKIGRGKDAENLIFSPV